MSFLVPKKPQILYAPMLATFGGGSARGFNPGGGPPVPAEMIEIGDIDGTTLSDTQAGDLVVILYGSLVTPPVLVAPSGFTQIAQRTSTFNWSPPTSHYYVQGAMGYKILNGSETTIAANGTFIQWRFPSPITSVSPTGTKDRSGGGSGSFSAAPASSMGAVMVAGRGAYGGGSGSFSGLTPADTTTYSKSDATTGGLASIFSFESGSYSASAGGFSGPSFFSQFVCYK